MRKKYLILFEILFKSICCRDDPERCSIYELSGEIVSLIEELKKRKRCEEDDEFKEQQLKEEEELEIQAIMNKVGVNLVIIE